MIESAINALVDLAAYKNQNSLSSMSPIAIALICIPMILLSDPDSSF
jgi:hypothetical protein